MLSMAIDKLLMLDIETVSQYPEFGNMPEKWQELWQHKSAQYLKDGDTAETLYPKRAAILAEFGKIICISMGYFKTENDKSVLRIHSFASDDERELLLVFMESLAQWQRIKKGMFFCGHNIKEFDMPYICRRLLVNRIAIPVYMDFQNMKPWETNIVDTMQFWKFGDFKNFITLNLLAACLDVESPKDDIDGSMVGDVYWKECDLPRIVVYCQKDVVTVAQVILRMKNLPLLEETQIEVV